MSLNDLEAWRVVQATFVVPCSSAEPCCTEPARRAPWLIATGEWGCVVYQYKVSYPRYGGIR